MKKIIIGTVVITLVLAIGATTAFAAGGRWAGRGTGPWIGQGTYCQFTDNDGDGICDNRGVNCWDTEAGAAGLCGHFMHSGHCWRS